jgi:predicted dehydrogenase
MSSAKARWGVIGSGGIAMRRTIPEGIMQAANAQLVAIYDVNQQANRDLAAKLGVKACAFEDELLGEEIDAVYIATPAYLHHDQVIRAADAGKHILCEKPLGLTVAQAQAMLNACRQASVELGAAFMMRFQSQHQAALKMIQEGRLGQMVFARAQLSCWYPPIQGAWRQDPKLGGGGSLIDMGGHCIDLLEMFLGKAVSVQCSTANRIHSYASEDSAAAVLKFESGAMAIVDAFFCIPDAASKNVLELYGTNGGIIAAGTIGQGEAGSMKAYLEDAGGYDASQQRQASAGLDITPQPRNPYRAEIEEFSSAVLAGKPSSLSAEIGLRSQAVICACYESAHTGKAVTLS